MPKTVEWIPMFRVNGPTGLPQPIQVSRGNMIKVDGKMIERTTDRQKDQLFALTPDAAVQKYLACKEQEIAEKETELAEMKAELWRVRMMNRHPAAPATTDALSPDQLREALSPDKLNETLRKGEF